MPNDFIKVEIKGIEELQAALQQVPRQVQHHLAQAGNDAAKLILKTEGIQKYPPADSANAPPTPYYIRGRGMQYKYGNNMKSEKYGTRWTVESSAYKTTIGNSASYAPYLAGDEYSPHKQAKVMDDRGWRILREVVDEKMPQIIKIFETWVDKLLIACKLK
jgi:hypothetical protein